MKSKSIKSLAALFGAVVALNVSVLAGPGPQSQPSVRKTSEPKKVAVTVASAQTQKTTGKAIVKTNAAPQVIYEVGAHGGTYVTRR